MRVLLFVAAILLATPSMAAVVSNVSGTVQVNQGNGFRTIPGSSEVKSGNVVRTGSNSSATVYYENGCALSIGENQTVTIQNDPTCNGANAAGNVGAVAVGIAAVGGAIGLAVALSKDDGPASP